MSWRDLARCPRKDWYAGRCELARGHLGSHFARWYGTGDAGEAVWSGDRDNEKSDDDALGYTHGAMPQKEMKLRERWVPEWAKKGWEK